RFPGAGDADFEEYLAYAVETLSALLRPSESLRPHLRADAHINLARVYYLEERYYSRRARTNVDGTVPRPDHDPAGLHAQAEVARNRALHELAQVEELAGHLTIRGEDRDDLTMSQLLPDLLGEKWESKSERQRNDLRNRSWVFRELCIASLVRGEMALDDFEQFNERMKSGDLSPGRKVYMKNFRQIVGRLRNVRRFEAGTSGNGRQAYDISMHKALAGMSPDRDTTGAVNAALGAARAFGLAVRYGELLSPRSWLLIASRNAFYRRVKTYSVEQLELLDVALRIVSSSPEYEKVASFGVLKRTLRDYFGYDAQSGANREI
ncbi:MAG TPA: hypothetical protein VF434_01210, partial [Promineifilum sp.]